ncbi:MAG: tetratricopeptide repeat protein [Phycisphaerales bacterium]|nr:tetratricopeptide repeat protein [Phycisphaerales bacterium]
MTTIAETLQQGIAAHREGRLDEAERLYADVLATSPQNANAHNLLGTIRAQQGRFDEAVEMFRQATQAADGHAEFHRNLGHALRRAGRPVEAAASYERAAELMPDEPGLLFDLANAYRENGQTRMAIQSLRDLLVKQPNNLSAKVNLGGLLIDEFKHKEAQDIFEQVLRANPRVIEARISLGRVLVERNELRQAEQVLSEAVRQSPENAVARMNLGKALLLLNRSSQALLHLNEAVRLAPNDPLVRINRASALRLQRQTDESNRDYELAIRLAPTNVTALFGMAYNFERQGMLDDALQLLDRALAINPMHVMSNLMYARIDRREKRIDQARARLEAVLERLGKSLPEDIGGALRCEYAQVLDAAGEYDLAYEEMTVGQDLLRQAGDDDYDLGTFLGVIEYFRDATSDEVVSKWPTVISGDAEDEPEPPIFFIGFPRSGTTLTEAMLGAHPALVTTDELPILERVMDLVPGMVGRPIGTVEGLSELNDNEIRSLRRQYHRYAERMMEEESISGRRIVDKYPLNIVRLPVVRRIFPEAKILMAIRDPRDVCLSCFFQAFTKNAAMLHFYRMDTTARLYASVMDMWFKFRESLGINYFETRYEDLVEDTEGQARKLLDFLGVEWNDDVLDHTKRGAGKAISTPSYIGIGQPIYKQSKQRWRKYEKQLEPVMPVLDPFIKALGYE